MTHDVASWLFETMSNDETAWTSIGWQALKVMRKLNERSVFLRPAHRADGSVAPQGGRGVEVELRAPDVPLIATTSLCCDTTGHLQTVSAPVVMRSGERQPCRVSAAAWLGAKFIASPSNKMKASRSNGNGD